MHFYQICRYRNIENNEITFQNMNGLIFRTLLLF